MRRTCLALDGVVGGIAVATAISSLWIFPVDALPLKSSLQTLDVFCAPSRLPAGDGWIFIGSNEDLPQDLQASALAVGVSVLDVQWVSPKALCVRIQALHGTAGNLLQVTSASTGTETVLGVTLGDPVGSLTVDAGFKEEDKVDGRLVLDGDAFLYGYFPGEGVGLASVRIHNRATMAWTCHEIAAQEAILAEEEPLVVDNPNFVATDMTLLDTDGDGIFDFKEDFEPPPPVPGQLGVELAPGLNVLDLITIDDNGGIAWRTIEVFTSFRKEV